MCCRVLKTVFYEDLNIHYYDTTFPECLVKTIHSLKSYSIIGEDELFILLYENLKPATEVTDKIVSKHCQIVGKS